MFHKITRIQVQNTLMLSVSNAQVGGTLDISGYDIDISGTNILNASGNIRPSRPTNKTANAVNRDVSLNDLSANTTYELSFNIVGSVDDLSNASIGLNGTTRPSDFLFQTFHKTTRILVQYNCIKNST